MKENEALVLGLETSCDETAVALLDGAGGARASRVSSQEEAHRRFGGVVPEIAARAHLQNLPPLLDGALADAGASLADVTAVAATAGPGLVGALLVGLSEGKGLALGLSVPFVPVNHIEGHALSPFLDGAGGPAVPPPETFTALVISGGHTHVFSFERDRIERLARTRDDAAGEAFDKVAKMAGLGYPGGPAVDRLARRGRAARPFPVPHFKDGSPDFSFSGLKTAARERLVELGRVPVSGFAAGPTLREEEAPGALCDLMADVEEAIVAQLLHRLSRLHEARRLERLTVSGGVAANTLVRERIPVWGRARGVDVRLAPRALTGDNGVMVAFAGLLRLRSGRTGEGLGAVARSRWPLETLR
ncbi:MAG TPA: tRNA (adenosine(37)-N6)-threonylcarbamoyltransferase complex transferase subunit TsaD [Thermoanaerobaculia bacterium]|nr:tRNA (adenosine(37)-N6)-threonylcarbamoyltransferase complex transferase subunit TsaD [Thermoanaerobaculia bacterium]